MTLGNSETSAAKPDIFVIIDRVMLCAIVAILIFAAGEMTQLYYQPIIVLRLRPPITEPIFEPMNVGTIMCSVGQTATTWTTTATAGVNSPIVTGNSGSVSINGKPEAVTDAKP